MSCDNKIHVGNIGTAFRVTIRNEDNEAENISAATTKELIFLKPDGDTETKSAAFTTDGTDGQIEYVAVSGFLDIPGLWQYQAHVIYSGGEYYSSIVEFEVEENL